MLNSYITMCVYLCVCPWLYINIHKNHEKIMTFAGKSNVSKFKIMHCLNNKKRTYLVLLKLLELMLS